MGYIFKYADGSRFVFRKSGTGSSGATIKVYLEKFSSDSEQDTALALKEISDCAMSLCQLHELSGRKDQLSNKDVFGDSPNEITSNNFLNTVFKAQVM